MTAASRTESVGAGHYAVAAHPDGIALLQRGEAGLEYRVSADGVVWEARPCEFQDAGLLPLCGHEDRIFLRDTTGAVHTMDSGAGGLSTLSPQPAPFPATKWYETSPSMDELAVMHETDRSRYRVFFAARRKTGRHPERRACVGTATSTDLARWTVEPPVYAPNRHPHILSPHVSADASHMALFYATEEPGGSCAIHYALASSVAGPYASEEPNVLACDVRRDLRTVTLGGKRLVFFRRAAPGEPPTPGVSRPGILDFLADGRPVVRFYDALLKLTRPPILQTEATLSGSGPFVRVLTQMARNFRFSARIRSHDAAGVGLLFRTTITGHDNITLWLDYESRTLQLRRGVLGRTLHRAPTYMVHGQTHHVSVWAEGGFADIYVNGVWTLSTTTEGRDTGGFGLAVRDGEARFEDVAVQLIPAP